jgi:nucleoid DNA-binding protein
MKSKMTIGTRVNKNELIRLIAQDTDLQMKYIRIVLNSMIGTISRILENEDSIQIDRLGIFYTTKIPEQDAWDGINKIRYLKPAGKRIGFKPAKELKRTIK